MKGCLAQINANRGDMHAMVLLGRCSIIPLTADRAADHLINRDHTHLPQTENAT
jgi:hypothetical protein